MLDPENDLEHSRVKAATDPSHRPQFYRDVLALGVQMLLLANLDHLAEGLGTVGIPPALFVIGALFIVGVLLVSGVGMPSEEPVGGGGVTVVSSVTTEPNNLGRG